MQANVSAKVLFQQVEAAHTYATNGPQTGLNITIQDTADVLSRLEVRAIGIRHRRDSTCLISPAKPPSAGQIHRCYNRYLVPYSV